MHFKLAMSSAYDLMTVFVVTMLLLVASAPMTFGLSREEESRNSTSLSSKPSNLSVSHDRSTITDTPCSKDSDCKIFGRGNFRCDPTKKPNVCGCPIGYAEITVAGVLPTCQQITCNTNADCFMGACNQTDHHCICPSGFDMTDNGFTCSLKTWIWVVSLLVVVLLLACCIGAIVCCCCCGCGRGSGSSSSSSSRP